GRQVPDLCFRHCPHGRVTCARVTTCVMHSVRMTVVAPQVATARTGLQLTREFATRLDEAGIRYCHFKSNQHLEAAHQATTDMDVLVDRRAGPKLTEILGGLGCKRFSAPPSGDYP